VSEVRLHPRSPVLARGALRREAGPKMRLKPFHHRKFYIIRHSSHSLSRPVVRMEIETETSFRAIRSITLQPHEHITPQFSVNRKICGHVIFFRCDGLGRVAYMGEWLREEDEMTTTVAQLIEFLRQFPHDTEVDVLVGHSSDGWPGDSFGRRSLVLPAEGWNDEGYWASDFFELTGAYPDRKTPPMLFIGKD